MRLQDAIMLGEWLYEARPLLKAYRGHPDLTVDLLAGSLAARIRRFDGSPQQEWADEFWDGLDTAQVENEMDIGTLIGPAIIAAIVLFALWKNWDKVEKAIGKLDEVKDKVEKAVDKLKD